MLSWWVSSNRTGQPAAAGATFEKRRTFDRAVTLNHYPYRVSGLVQAFLSLRHDCLLKLRLRTTRDRG